MAQREFAPPQLQRPEASQYQDVGLDILAPAGAEPHASRPQARPSTSQHEATTAAPHMATSANVVAWEHIKKDPAAEAAHAKVRAELNHIARVIATVPKLPEQRPATSMEPFSFQRPTEPRQASYPDDRPLRQRFLQKGSAESGNQALARSSEIGGVAEPKVTLVVGALQQLGYEKSLGFTKNEDRIGVGKSTFVVCDGMGGEITNRAGQQVPDGPATAARVGAETILADLEAGGVHYKTSKAALDRVKEVLVHASWAIEENKGTGTTASTAKVLYVDGKPKLALAAAGDSGIFLDPMPEEANRGTRRYIDENVYTARSYSQRHIDRAEHERAVRLAFDGGLPYEWTVDEIGHGTSTYIGVAGEGEHNTNAASKDGDITMRLGLLDLEPGRTRVMICSDGITGDGARQLISAEAFKQAFEQRNPLDAADAFMKASKKWDDKSLLVVDIYVDEAGVAHIEPAAEPEASDAARVAQWDADIAGADTESLEPLEPAEPAPESLEAATVLNSPDIDEADNLLTPPAEPTSSTTPEVIALPKPVTSPRDDNRSASEDLPVSSGVAEARSGLPLMSRFDALTYDQWKDRLPLGDNSRPLSYRDWISMGIGQRQAYLEQHGLWDTDTLQKMTAERAGIDYTSAPYLSRVASGASVTSDTFSRSTVDPAMYADETVASPLSSDLRDGRLELPPVKGFEPPDSRTIPTRPARQASGAGLPPLPPETPPPPADTDDALDDGWSDVGKLFNDDSQERPAAASTTPMGSRSDGSLTPAQGVVQNINRINDDGSANPPATPRTPNVPSGQPPLNSSQPPVVPPNIPASPNTASNAPESRGRTLKRGAAVAALATVAALSTFELGQSHHATAERPRRSESSIAPGGPTEPSPAEPSATINAPATQHEGNIDFQVTDTNGRVSRVTTELRDHGTGRHGAPWDAARTALESIGIAHPSEAQIATLTNNTLTALNMSPAAARELPDGYKLTYDVVDGKLVPRARS